MVYKTRKTRVREFYFYETKTGYKIDLINGRNQLVNDVFHSLTKTDVNSFLEKLSNDTHDKFTQSSFGMKIYNKKPEQRMLTKEANTVFETYINKLNSLKEDTYYRHKVAAILRNVSDILDGPEDCQAVEPSDPEPFIIPEYPISPKIPMELVGQMEEKLKTCFNPSNATFIFSDEKFQLTKDGHKFDSQIPGLLKPKASNKISSTMQYMVTLLGVNAEKSGEIGDNSFRFTWEDGEVYRVTYIYTGERNHVPVDPVSPASDYDSNGDY